VNTGALWFAAGGVCAAAGTALLVRLRVASPPAVLVRTNVNGRPVPAVLGGPLCIGALAGLGALSMGRATGAVGSTSSMLAAVAILVAALGAAGAWDDLRGDERPRGFRAHLASLRRRRVTGGIVKLAAGGAAGLAAGYLTTEHPLETLVTAVVVALTANLFNLLDRAPGRATKVAILVAVPLFVVAPHDWRIAASPVAVAALVTLPWDVRERAMLGDAGANPLGAVVGLGVAASLDLGVEVVAAAVLLGANLASERWSFSAVIRGTSALRFLDDIGRAKEPG